MNIDMLSQQRISFDIENVHISVSFDGGFFNLDKTESAIHNHSGYEFHLCMEGTSTIKGEAEVFSMNQGEAYLVPPGILHRSVSDKRQSVTSSFCFSFRETENHSESNMYLVFRSALDQIKSIHKLSKGESYLLELKKIISEFYLNSPLGAVKIKHSFLLLIMSILEELTIKSEEMKISAPETFGSSAEKNLRRIVIEEYMNTHYHKNISLKELSNVLYLSTKQTARVFMSEFGMNFKSYISKYRITIAAHLLKSTEDDIQSIAKYVGYESYNGFYTSFKEHTGYTPREYRKKYKN
ncbi:MAG: helix-turn-helix transcriptional regulator [Clostridia bacterium]|nr:helix-turn-helix transcriptional regulator [Clostridia bacterium]